MLTAATLAVVVVFLAIPRIERLTIGPVPGRALALLLVGGVVAGGAGMAMASSRKDAADKSFQSAKSKADARAAAAIRIAKNGIPPEGALAMMARDPELRGEAIFSDSCAGCHALGSFGDLEKTRAPALDGWGTEAWLVKMMHDPDGEHRFGKTAYLGEMPSMDVPPKEADPDAPPFKAMSADDMRAAAAFLAAQGDEPEEASPAGAARRDAKIAAKRS
jgi:ubiquinol-cytochrome c reductase cytochrome b subunit